MGWVLGAQVDISFGDGTTRAARREALYNISHSREARKSKRRNFATCTLQTRKAEQSRAKPSRYDIEYTQIHCNITLRKPSLS